jgi:hypothetical protein
VPSNNTVGEGIKCQGFSKKSARSSRGKSHSSRTRGNTQLFASYPASISRQHLPRNLRKPSKIIRRVERLIERERQKGLSRHWAYDLNRHIALKQALEQLRQVHCHSECPLAEGEIKPWNARRRPKAPSRKRTEME